MHRFLMIFLAGALLAPTAAQSNPDYPNKPVRIIVNVAPGGGVDTATRIIADKLRARLGQPFVVENRPGAGGNIGAEVVFQSEGDGYTLLASSPTPLAINGWLYKKLNFDPAGFEPVAMMSRIPNVLVVRPDFPAKSVQEVVAVAKANPGKFTFGSQGIGTASHLTGELFMTLTGTKLVHVPYKGNTSNVLTDVVAGHVDLSFIQFSAVHELQQSGKLRVLAVATDKRMEALPDVPTMAEAGFPDIVSETWNAISAPPKTPEPDHSQAQRGDQRGAAGTGSPGALARSAGAGGRRRRGPDEKVRRGAARALGQSDQGCQRAAAMNHRQRHCAKPLRDAGGLAYYSALQGKNTMADKQYDRSTQDLGNIVNLGHVNVCITDQHLATHYYVTGLGLTRDPFLNTGARLMWINVGMSQFHLPNGQPDVLRGVTGLVVPDRAALLDRLAQVRKPLEGTKFDFRETNDCVETVCPWGNRINVHAPDENRFGRIVLGMPYIEFDVRPGTADRIARFYRDVMGALATVVENGSGRKARVQVGEKQYWYFRETDEPEKPYDRHHAQIYIANFSGPYRRLKELGLITMEVNEHEYRFKDVIDLDTREVLFTVEHEVRSQTHPLYGRPLINRNPAQSNRAYKPGHDSMSWAMA